MSSPEEHAERGPKIRERQEEFEEEEEAEDEARRTKESRETALLTQTRETVQGLPVVKKLTRAVSDEWEDSDEDEDSRPADPLGLLIVSYGT